MQTRRTLNRFAQPTDRDPFPGVPCTLRSRRARRAVAHVYRLLARGHADLCLVRRRLRKIAPMTACDRIHGQWSPDDGRILLNERLPNAAQLAYVFAHEIGHALQPDRWAGPDSNPEANDDSMEASTRDREAFADWFAARLLVGTHDLTLAHPQALQWAQREANGHGLLNAMFGPDVPFLRNEPRDDDAQIEADLPFAVARSLVRRWSGHIGPWAYLVRRDARHVARCRRRFPRLTDCPEQAARAPREVARVALDVAPAPPQPLGRDAEVPAAPARVEHEPARGTVARHQLLAQRRWLGEDVVVVARAARLGAERAVPQHVRRRRPTVVSAGRVAGATQDVAPLRRKPVRTAPPAKAHHLHPPTPAALYPLYRLESVRAAQPRHRRTAPQPIAPDRPGMS